MLGCPSPAARGIRALAAAFTAAGLLAIAASPAAAAPTWLSPTALAPATTDFTNPGSLVVAPDGTVIAAWTLTGSVGAVKVAVRPPGGSFGAAQTLSTTGHDASSIQLAVDKAGNAVAVWIESNGANYIVRGALKSPQASTFGSAFDISGTGRDAFGPQVAISNGTAIATWGRYDGSNDIVQAAVKPAGASFFGAAGDLSASGQNADQAAVAMDANGNAVLGWERFNGTVEVIQAAVRPAGGSFTPLADVFMDASASDHLHGPQLAMDNTGRATMLISYYNNAVGRHIIKSFARGLTGNFGPFDDVSDPTVDAGSSGYFNLAVEPISNTAIAIWNATVVQAAARPSGGSFGSVQDVSGPGAFTGDPAVAFDAAGDAVAVWQGSDGSNAAIQTAMRPAGGQFGAVSNIQLTDTTKNESAYGPTPVAIDNEGNAATLWAHQTFDGSTYHYEAEAAGLDAAPPELNNVNVPATATAGQPVAVSVSAFDRWSPFSVTWGFGDGATADGMSVSHVYGAQGTYTVTVTGTDAPPVSNAASMTRTIQVQPPPSPPPPPPRITSPINNTWLVSGKNITAVVLTAGSVPAGSTITMKCTGKPRCRFKKKTIHVKKTGKVNLLKALGRKNRRFKAGETLEIQITHPGYIGKDVRFKFRKGKVPKGTVRCFKLGATKPSAC